MDENPRFNDTKRCFGSIWVQKTNYSANQCRFIAIRFLSSFSLSLHMSNAAIIAARQLANEEIGEQKLKKQRRV